MKKESTTFLEGGGEWERKLDGGQGGGERSPDLVDGDALALVVLVGQLHESPHHHIRDALGGRLRYPVVPVRRKRGEGLVGCRLLGVDHLCLLLRWYGTLWSFRGCSRTKPKL